MIKQNLLSKILFLVLALVTMIDATAQVDGDYQTRASGNWNANTTWQVRSSGAWVDCGIGDYPGASTGAGTVNLLDNHTVTITADVPNAIGALRIDAGAVNTYLQFNAGFALTVTGQTYLNSNTNNIRKGILIDAGIFITGSVYANSSANPNSDAYLQISSGSLTVNSDITLNSNGQRTYIRFSAAGTLYIGGTITGGNITSQNGGGAQAPTSGTIIYNGSSQQVIGSYTYYNLTTDNSSGFTLAGDVTVDNTLDMTLGNITTGSNSIIISNSSAGGGLSYTSGTVIGTFQRAINTPTGIEYLYPVGTSGSYNPIKITFTNLTAGDLAVQFQPLDIGTAGLPLNDAGTEIYDRFITGYWTMTAIGALVSTDYSVNLNYNGFPGFNDLTILKRTDGGNLTLDGTHGTVSGSEITRTGMNGISTVTTDLALGKSYPRFTTHPSDASGCNVSFTVAATGRVPLTYQWQEDSGSGFADISDGGIYSGATTTTLTITGADQSMNGNLYRCMATDVISQSTTSNSATLNYSPVVSLGFNWSMEITLAAAIGPDDLTDFPALISFTDPLLRSEANGGHVSNSNGYDIGFTDQNGSKLDHELEFYDPATGQYVGWVRIPLLSNSSTTTINMLYGDPSVVSDPSVESVWTSNYKGVWHLNGIDYTDATEYSNDGTENATSDVTGKIAGGRGFNGTTSYIQVGTNGFVPNDNNQTISIWGYYTASPSGNRNLISFQNAAASSAIQLGFRGGNAVAWKWGGVILADAGTAPSTGSWHYYVYTYDGTTSRIYIDGVEMGNSTVAPQTALPSEGNIGRYNNGEYIAADLDEPRFSMSPKSAGWILTEYNNQDDPSGFITLGTETSNSLLTTIGLCSSTFTLDQGFPAGGNYSGPGVTGTNFDASSAGLGTHTITYIYTDINGCTGNVDREIVVTALPSAPIAADIECCISNILDMVATGTNLRWYSDAALTALVGTGTPFATGQTAIGTYTYYVTQTLNGCESSATTASLIVYDDIVINIQPQPETICEGDNAVFTVDASGNNITYQWQEDGADITDGGIYSGATTETLTLTDPGVINSGKSYSVNIYGICGSSPLTSNGAILTVTALPVADFSYAGTPYCLNASNPSPTFTGGGVAGTFSSTPGLVFVSTATGEVDIAASTPGDYTVTNTIAASGGCGIVIATSPITISADLVWTGSIDADWNTTGNWSCGYIPMIINNVYIPSVANDPVLSTGAVGTINNLVIDPGASLSITGNTIQIAGTITNNGTFDAGSAIVEMNGSAAQVIGANVFESNTILDLRINNPAGVSLLGQLNITGILIAETGDLDTGGNLTLISDASQTALIDGSGTGDITGSVTMQRYLDTGFGYKYFSSPLQAATVSEFGDDMDLGATFPAVYRYDESRTSSGWVSYNNPANALIPLEGYIFNFGGILAPNTVDVSGTISNGPQSITLYNNNNTYTKGMNLVGNPYPSPIDWDAAAGWTRTNIDDAVYYFKASTTDQYGGTYSSYVNGISSDGSATNIIPSMQGFFVHVSDGAYPVTGTLAMDNSVRVNNLTHPFLKSISSPVNSILRLAAVFSDDDTSLDPAVLYFDDMGSESFDPSLDALKLFNTDLTVPNIYFPDNNGKKLSVNALPLFDYNPTTIPVGLKINRDGQVVFKITESGDDFTGIDIKLTDILVGVETDLGSGNEYSILLTAGEYTGRFFLNLSSMTTGIDDIKGAEELFTVYNSNGILKTYFNIDNGTDGLFVIYSLSGKILFSTKVYGPGYHEFNPGLSGGLYMVSYISGNRSSTKKLFINSR